MFLNFFNDLMVKNKFDFFKCPGGSSNLAVMAFFLE